MNIFNEIPNYQSFAYKWNVNFPNLVPLSYQFKAVLRHKWVRIHNFSGQQRYPRNQADKAGLLIRHNKVMKELLGESIFYSLIISCEETLGFPQNYEELVNTQEYEQINEVPLHVVQPDEFNEELYVCWAFKKMRWVEGEFDKLLVAMAEDKIWDSFFISFEKQCFICPYDGGLDLFIENRQERNEFKQKFKDWIPDYYA